MKEIWKDIPKYKGYYQVSNLGRVRSLDRVIVSSKLRRGKTSFRKGKIRHLTPNNNGYLAVILNKNGKMKRYLVHRLVAITFIPNPHHYSDVNHIDENKTNNKVINLEWCSRKYNDNYGSRNIRMELNDSEIRPVILIRGAKHWYFKSYAAAGRFINNNVNKPILLSSIQTQINHIKNGKGHSVRGFKVKFPKDK